jgi:hypothetical protein
VNFVLVTAATTALLWYQETLPSLLQVAIVAIVILSLLVWGALFEAKSWAVPLEWGRLVVLVALAAWFTQGMGGFIPLMVCVGAGVLAIWAGRYRAWSVRSAAELVGGE